MTKEQEREWRREAEVFALLSDPTIDDLVASFRRVARDRKRPNSERERASALIRLLEARVRKPRRKRPGPA
jgi:hypothetical protein